MVVVDDDDGDTVVRLVVSGGEDLCSSIVVGRESLSQQFVAQRLCQAQEQEKER